MPAALLVLLAALAGIFGVPATASDGPATGRSVVREPAPQRLVAASRSTPAARAGTTSAAVHRLARPVTAPRSGPAPAAALSGVLLLLVLAVLGRAVGAGGGWSLPRRTPASHRGRAPPAYALALS